MHIRQQLAILIYLSNKKKVESIFCGDIPFNLIPFVLGFHLTDASHQDTAQTAPPPDHIQLPHLTACYCVLSSQFQYVFGWAQERN